ncbi:MAG: TAXI family TRAP transporter solute-binding subunit [Chromatiales bacterium]|nr:MAG: TAXI family TRAP transporter solute-binding subunit [Chromatiales bacterium]
MSRGLKRAWQGIRDIGGTWGLGILVIVAATVAAYQFVGPPPPSRIAMATGQPGGAYERFGKRYAEVLARDGITVELKSTAGSVENLALLDAGDADIAFVQSGLKDVQPTDNVLALGSLYLEPLLLFLREGLNIDDIGDLAGARINVGAEGSGTRAVALTLLAANGVNERNAELSELGGVEAATAFARGNLDAAFLVAAPESSVVRQLSAAPGVTLYDFERTPAYARVYRFLSPVLLPEGILDLDANVPDRDIHATAPTAMLAANQALHPALIDLLLVAATEIHGGSSLLSDPGDFPAPRFIDLPLSPEAERHYEFGPPFLLRYLPFWAATLVDRLWVLLLPLIGLAIPVFKLVPPAFRWRVRRRLLNMYDELDTLDPAQRALADEGDLKQRLERLESIDQEVAELAVPRSYTDDVYKLRRDIDLVRRRLHVSGQVIVTAPD